MTQSVPIQFVFSTALLTFIFIWCCLSLRLCLWLSFYNPCPPLSPSDVGASASFLHASLLPPPPLQPWRIHFWRRKKLQTYLSLDALCPLHVLLSDGTWLTIADKCLRLHLHARSCGFHHRRHCVPIVHCCHKAVNTSAKRQPCHSFNPIQVCNNQPASVKRWWFLPIGVPVAAEGPIESLLSLPSPMLLRRLSRPAIALLSICYALALMSQ